MKQSFVHSAELELEPGSDSAAPGGAVTIALCGSWDHEGACRWPHETRAELRHSKTNVRVVFSVEAENEVAVRKLIREALANGQCTGPDGTPSRWALIADATGILTEDESQLWSRASH